MRIVPILAVLAASLGAQAAVAQRIVVVLPASARTVSSVVILPLADAQPGQPEPKMRPRLTGAMVDIYPVDGTGFHLSGGLRFFSNRSYLRETAQATRGLLYLPRTPGNPGNRWGYRRTPGVAFGYTETLGSEVTMGLEVGTIMGRATNLIRRPGSRGGGGASGPNSIVHLDFGVRF